MTISTNRKLHPEYCFSVMTSDIYKVSVSVVYRNKTSLMTSFKIKYKEKKPSPYILFYYKSKYYAISHWNANGFIPV